MLRPGRDLHPRNWFCRPVPSCSDTRPCLAIGQTYYTLKGALSFPCHFTGFLLRLGQMVRLSLGKIGFLLIISLLLAGCSIPFFGKKKQAALQVMTMPKATVFLDGEHVGTTPYFDETLKPGDYTLKLVPEDAQVQAWENKIKLSPGIMTVVSRELTDSPDLSSGYILSLEPLADKKMVSLAVVTSPDGAVVSLDGEPKGFSPISIDDLTEGEHLLVVSSPGYAEKSMKPKLIAGHKLTATVQLAKLPDEEDKSEEEEEDKDKDEDDEEAEEAPAKTSEKKTATSSASTVEDEMERPYVKIKDTPTGWLNVRSEPSTSGKEETVITKVDPGEVFAFIEKNDTGWYKIELDDGEEGWIAASYAELFD